MQEMNTKQREFILLRADGLSFDKIAKELKTSKPTLIQWSKLFDEEIKTVQFEAFLSIKESFSWNQKAKYKTLLKQMELVNKGITNADISQVNLKDLFTIKNNLVAQIESIEKRIDTDSKVVLTNEFGHKEQLRLNLYEAE